MHLAKTRPKLQVTVYTFGSPRGVSRLQYNAISYPRVFYNIGVVDL
jgi:hypothetical protein